MPKPRLFIGSSTEALPVAKAIELQLVRHCYTKTWDSGAFRLSRGTLEDLERAAGEHQFAVLILSPDDMITSRKRQHLAPRDNVIFELGLFVGKLGRAKTFVVTDPQKVKIPSDWLGVTIAAVEWERVADPEETLAAVSPACTQILDGIRQAPPTAAHPSQAAAPSSPVLPGLDELYDAVTGASTDRGAVVVSQNDTSWAWSLFPTVLEWRLSELPVTVYTTRIQGNEKKIRQERYRRSLLDRLGVRIITRKHLKVCGFFLGIGERDHFSSIVLSNESGGYEPLAVRYDSDIHWAAAEALLNETSKSWKDTAAGVRPKLRKEMDTTVCGILRQSVRQYTAPGVRVKPEFIPTKDLKVISRYTRKYRYRQIERLADRYRKIRIDPFKALRIQLTDQSWSIVTPPVVESGPHGLVVIEGNTRATFAAREGIEDFFCLLVERCDEPLPGVPISISDVTVSPLTRVPTDRIEGFDYSHFRHIERAIHPY